MTEFTDTRLKDRNGRKILVGHVVHWTDGGDELTLRERIATRWDRIAVVYMQGILPQFKVIDSPHKATKAYGNTFCYGNFIYKDTEKYLTIVAESIDDYHNKFNNAGDVMEWVLENTK